MNTNQTRTEETTTMGTVKMTGTTMLTGTVRTAQFVISGSVSAELATLLTGLGWTLTGENGDLRWYSSPVCSTPAQIDAARPASLRKYITA